MSKTAGDSNIDVERSTRSRAPSSRKCCACQCQQRSRELLNVGRKRPSVKPGKNNAHVDKPMKVGPDVLPSVASAKSAVQLRPAAVKHKPQETATASAETSAVLEEEGTSEPQEKAGDEKKIAQVSRTRRIKTRPAVTPNNSETVTTAIPRKILRKKAEPVPHVNKANRSTSKLKTPAVRKKEPAENFVAQFFEDIGCGYHITWDGFDEPAEYRTGEVCGFCETDFAVPPGDSGDNTEFSTLPVVAILPCGHAFHVDCLDQAELGVSQGDPSCVLCESIM